MRATFWRSFAIAGVIMLLAGCATAGIETNATIIDGDMRRHGKKTRNDIDLFEEKKPSQPYQEIARIKALGIDKSTKEGLVEAMQIRAARIGADALVNITFSSEPVTGGPTGGLFCPTWKECRYLGGDSVITSRPTAEATAIVYTTESETRDSELGKTEGKTDKKKGPE